MSTPAWENDAPPATRRHAGLPWTQECKKQHPFPGQAGQPQCSFWQNYLDNYAEGTPIPWDQVAAALGKVSEWQQAVRDTYDAWNLPRAAQKAVCSQVAATELGAFIDGEAGIISPSSDKILGNLSFTAFVLGQPRVPKLMLQMLAGRWGFAMQFNRATMGAFRGVWQHIHKHHEARILSHLIEGEFLRAAMLAPLMLFDLKTPVSYLTTVSDASPHGAGVCASTGITAAGCRAVVGLPRPLKVSGADGAVLVIDLFAGIAASHRAFEVLGIRLGGSAFSEILPSAVRVLSALYADALQLGDVTAIDLSSVRNIANRFPNVTMVVLIAGSPCTDVSGLNASGKGLQGSQSGLYVHIPRVLTLVREVFLPFAVVHFCVECVQSMSAESEVQMSHAFGVEAVAVCCRSISWCSRPRLFWFDWPLAAGPGISFEDRERHRACNLTATKPQWPFDSEPQAGTDARFPCMVRAIRRKQPPFKPAGIHTCAAQDLAQWQAEDYRFPPYHYRPEHLVIGDKGLARPPNAPEREFVMGFAPDTTVAAFPKGERKSRTAHYEDERCSLVGNSISVPVLAFLLGQLLEARGMVSTAPSVQQIVDSCAVEWHKLPLGSKPNFEAGRALVSKCVRSACPKGSDVRLATGELLSTSVWPRKQVPADLWAWQVVVAYEWRHTDEHINALELRAYLASLKWRAKKRQHLGCRFLHLMDSQVSIGVAVKGRTSAVSLLGILEQCNALCLAAGFAPFLAYVHTDVNPADAPSRWRGRPVVTPKL